MKLLIIGLDCADPELVFGWKDELPNLKKLIDNGAYGKLRSTHTPITVPAWAVMMSGKDPGQLGYYGFRNRQDYSYDAYGIANSNAVKYDRAWDILSRAGKKIVLLGVPQTYPPTPVNGCVVSGFLAPSTESNYTYPVPLKDEIEEVSNGYIIDVENFRTNDKEALLGRIYEKTEKLFTVAKHLIKNKPWDFFMLVEMGIDRIHHGFWSYIDPTHHKYEAGNPFENSIKDYYKYCDKEIGKLIALAPDDTIVMVVSDHGATKMDGGICFNEWLIKEGYLTLKEYPSEPTRIADLEIDWSKTMAWGEGGYYGRLFMNVKGREPEGIVAPEDYEKVRSELIEKIAWGLDNRKEGIIYKEWKLIKNLDDQTYELYNLENDPEEKRNLIEEKYIVDKDFADDLKKRLSSFKKERATSTTDIVKFNKEDVERLKALGYIQ
jgi:predicted AlkP superfamily phosphohydrolase/phosphomutase